MGFWATENFKDTVTQLLDGQAASVVHDLTELTGFVERVLADENWASQIGKKAQDVVLQHDGASERTVNYICELLGRYSQNGHRSAA